MLPEGFPHKEKLEAAGFDSPAKVKAAGKVELRAAGLSDSEIGEVRQYEKTNQEAPDASAAAVPPVATETPLPPRESADKPADEEETQKEQATTEKVTLGEARMFKGTIYGPGKAVEVPIEFAESLRRQKEKASS